MSYLVFARKWRPQTFRDVIAQEHVTKTLRNAIESERIGHAYLFTGPRGVGKTTTARILAKALNCDNGPTPDPCMECEACARIAAGGHLDVLEIDGASNRGIDEIRDLREKARYAAAEGGYKIYIIDEVHMLTREAFNALLKILEEPPDRVIFIFATTEPRKVPATILSRCQRFDFRRIPSSVMGRYISDEAGKEGITINADALSLVCRASGGSMRDALSIMDQLVSFSGKDIAGESVSRLLGLVEADLLADISASVLHSQGARVLDLIEDALVRGYSIEELIDALVGFLRNLLLAASGAEKGITDLSDSETVLIQQTVAGVSDVHVLNVLRLISGASDQIRTGASPRISLEAALMTASKLGIAFGFEDLPSVVERVATAAVKSGEITEPAVVLEVTESAVSRSTGGASTEAHTGIVPKAAKPTPGAFRASARSVSTESSLANNEGVPDVSTESSLTNNKGVPGDSTESKEAETEGVPDVSTESNIASNKGVPGDSTESNIASNEGVPDVSTESSLANNEGVPDVSTESSLANNEGVPKAAKPTPGASRASARSVSTENTSTSAVPYSEREEVEKKTDQNEKDKENSYVRKVSGLFDMIPENR